MNNVQEKIKKDMRPDCYAEPYGGGNFSPGVRMASQPVADTAIEAVIEAISGTMAVTCVYAALEPNRKEIIENNFEKIFVRVKEKYINLMR